MKFINTKALFAEINEIPEVLNQKFFPSLNGLRGIAVMLVVISHILLYQGVFYNVLNMGSVGVNIFFVLSGFLITTLCIKEKVLTGNLSLKNFYIRRAFRIFPVAYLYILVVFIINYIFNLKISYLSFFSSMFYLADFSYFRKIHFDWYLGHFWSLSVEEQFYLIFPLLLKKYYKAYVWLLLFILLALPGIFCLQAAGVITNHGILYVGTHFLIKFQAISLGCFFSILCFKGYLNFGKWRLLISLVSIAVICYFRYIDFFSVQATFSNLLVSTVTGFIIINSIYASNNFLYKFLNLKLLSTIGILSYSIYMWQELFFTDDKKIWFGILPYNIAFIIMVPCLSYYCYERYFLKLKEKFQLRQKTNSR